MARKRTDLDKTISRLQKNAGNKLYRMRKAGAADDDIVAIDPRRSTVGMNGSQKAAYARELERFNRRGGTYSITRDYFGRVAVVPTAKLNEYQRAERDYNKWIDTVRKNAQRQYGNLPYFAGDAPEPISKQEWERRYGPMPQDSGSMSSLQRVHREYGFGSERQLDKAIESLDKRRCNVQKIDKRLTNYKKAIANKMESEGVGDDAIRAIRSLTRSQLQYLYMNTDFSSIVSVFQYDNYYEKGHTRMAQAYYTTTADLVVDMVKTARKYAPKKFVPITRV